MAVPCGRVVERDDDGIGADQLALHVVDFVLVHQGDAAHAEVLRFRDHLGPGRRRALVGVWIVRERYRSFLEHLGDRENVRAAAILPACKKGAISLADYPYT